jgi:hypothetical protein
MKIFGRITTHNSVQINIITPNYAYYKIVQLTPQNEFILGHYFSSKHKYDALETAI